MKAHSGNIKPMAGILEDDLNIFKVDKISIKSIYNVVRYIIKYNYQQSMKRELNNDVIHTEIPSNELANIVRYIRDNSDVEVLTKAKNINLIYLSLPIFKVENNILTLHINNLIINDYLFEPGFKFTFDEDMINRIHKLSRVKIIEVQQKNYNLDIYDINQITQSEDMKNELLTIQNSLIKTGMEEYSNLVKELYDKKLTEDNVYITKTSCAVSIDPSYNNEDLNKYDKILTRTINPFFTSLQRMQYNAYLVELIPLPSNGGVSLIHDLVYLEWINSQEKYGFVNLNFEYFNEIDIKDSNLKNCDENFFTKEYFSNNSNLIKAKEYYKSVDIKEEYKQLFKFINQINL